MELKDKLIPNEVVIVGKLRDASKPADIALEVEGKTRPMSEIIEDVYAAFQFTRNTFNGVLPETAKQAGFQIGKFFQARMSDPGGEKLVLANGKTVDRSRKTTRPGFDNIFQASRADTFEDIATHLAAKKVEIVGGDPNNGKIRLTQYAQMGYWDDFAVGFWYTPHFYDPKQNGALVPLMATKKLDNGAYSKVKEPAITNRARHFVYEDEIDNLDAIRAGIISRLAKWEVKTVDNTAPAGITVDEEVVGKATEEHLL